MRSTLCLGRRGFPKIMAVARAVGRAVLWLLLGLVGSLAILVVATDAIDRRSYPRLQSGRVYHRSLGSRLCVGGWYVGF